MTIKKRIEEQLMEEANKLGANLSPGKLKIMTCCTSALTLAQHFPEMTLQFCGFMFN